MIDRVIYWAALHPAYGRAHCQKEAIVRTTERRSTLCLHVEAGGSNQRPAETYELGRVEGHMVAAELRIDNFVVNREVLHNVAVQSLRKLPVQLEAAAANAVQVLARHPEFQSALADIRVPSTHPS